MTPDPGPGIAPGGPAGEARRRADEEERSREGRRLRLTALAAASGALTALGFGLETWAGQRSLAHAAEALAALLGLWLVLPRAGRALRRLRPDTDRSMTVAVAGAVGLGDWLEAATVAFLFALSLALESWSASRARRAIAALLDFSPLVARVKAPGGWRGGGLARARGGRRHLFVVLPGERVPLDGEVTAGEGAVDEDSITGESAPVQKGRGALLFAGTINGEGALEATNLKPAQDTTLAHLVRMVEEAQGRRAGVERWVDRFAAVYTPAVMVAAGGGAAGAPAAPRRRLADMD